MSIRIKELISGVEYRVIQGTIETVVMEIAYDSRKTRSGSMFVCIKGYQTDGHDYIEEAVRRGVAIVVQQSNDWKKDRLPEQITVISVLDTRIALAEIAAAFYCYPAKEMQIIGVTGTKGKTTTTYMIREGLRQAGHKTGLIGTIEVNADGAETGSFQTEIHTTPESLELQQYLRIMADAGCDSVVMEVSSQALKMHRVEGIQFTATVFTNLGEDHIGPEEHADMQEYLECKRKLFLQTEFAAGNQNDALLEEVWAQTICRKVRYMVRDGECDGQNTQMADYVAEQIEHINLQGISLNIMDTAGIRDTEDIVEKIGVDKAINYAKDADLILFVIDASSELDENDIEILKMIQGKQAIILLNKSDLDMIVTKKVIENKVNELQPVNSSETENHNPIIEVSAKEKSGIAEFEQILKDMFYDGKLTFNDEIYITNVRQKTALQEAYRSLQKVNESIEMGMPEDFYSIDLLDAYESLGSITGETIGEDLVNEIFSKFCMGK